MLPIDRVIGAEGHPYEGDAQLGQQLEVVDILLILQVADGAVERIIKIDAHTVKRFALHSNRSIALHMEAVLNGSGSLLRRYRGEKRGGHHKSKRQNTGQ